MNPSLPPGPDQPYPPPATWRAIEAVPVFFMALIAAGLAAVPFSLLVSSCSANFVMATLMGELAFGGTVLAWVRYVNKAPLAALGAPREPLRDVVIGVAVGAALIVIGGIAASLVRALVSRILGHPVGDPEQVLPCVQGIGLALLGPVVVLAAPLGEEIFFRGFLYKGLRRRFSVWPAALISAVLFGAVHYAGPAFLILIPALTLVGLGLAFLYERRQSLVASMAAHATFNLVGFLTIAMSRR